MEAADQITAEDIHYDNLDRMKYHPAFHSKHGERFTEEELCYLCKFYKHDGRRAVSLALDRPELTIEKKYRELRQKHLVLYYKSLDYYC